MYTRYAPRLASGVTGVMCVYGDWMMPAVGHLRNTNCEEVD